MSDPTVSPRAYAAGPERDAARANRDAYHRWLRESPDPEAYRYRCSVDLMNRARRERKDARSAALRAFKRKLKADMAKAADPPAPTAGGTA